MESCSCIIASLEQEAVKISISARSDTTSLIDCGVVLCCVDKDTSKKELGRGEIGRTLGAKRRDQMRE